MGENTMSELSDNDILATIVRMGRSSDLIGLTFRRLEDPVWNKKKMVHVGTWGCGCIMIGTADMDMMTLQACESHAHRTEIKVLET